MHEQNVEKNDEIKQHRKRLGRDNTHNFYIQLYYYINVYTEGM